MNLLTAEVSNFGSYKHLSFDFSSQGLALIYGATGSGKSTLQDIPTWILFGVTAKDGNADEVRSWTTPDEPTIGTLSLVIRDSQIAITRIRGKSSQNDLYWTENDSVFRGKDITDTQRLLNERLGVDVTLYTIGAYYNEFSPAGSFFTARASDRRMILESLSDLQLPVLLTERIQSVKKETKKSISEILEKLNKCEGRSEQIRKSQNAIKRDSESWDTSQRTTIEELIVRNEKYSEEQQAKVQIAKLKAERFEVTRQITIAKYENDLEKRLDKFKKEKVCPSCGDVRNKDANELFELNEDYTNLIERERTAPNPFLNEQQGILNQENPYEARIKAEKYKVNPFLAQLSRLDKEIKACLIAKDEITSELELANLKQSSLVQLSSLSDQLRGALLKKTVKSIEFQVNRYLETYFDSEIRVVFDLDGGDKLSTLIWKSGHECSFQQLSKGQRSLLKLCFSVSVMTAASNKSGVHFNTLMFDESLDGLDSSLKLKAFNLFNELSKNHDTILVIDHNEELQNLFDKRYYVTISSDVSAISEE